ncbi:MAG: FkbM family methyltransferase [Nitrosomonadales bacterium]
MKLVSYAQNHEDIILWRALKHVESGCYVDVGANDPVDDSVTKLFYDRGWHGINIEPSEEYFARLQRDRSRDINLLCAVGANDGMVVFYEATTRGWSTSDENVGKQYCANAQATSREVPQLCLNTILEQAGRETIHFLKIDVEGAEAEVISGINFNRFRPWVLLIESLDPISLKPEFQNWEEEVISGGYVFVFFDGLNRYYVAKEHAELIQAFDAPANVLDDFIPFSMMQWTQRAIDAEATLDLIYASRSWRITAPLRKLNRGARNLFHCMNRVLQKFGMPR